jgi:hypothetical protein
MNEAHHHHGPEQHSHDWRGTTAAHYSPYGGPKPEQAVAWQGHEHGNAEHTHGGRYREFAERLAELAGNTSGGHRIEAIDQFGKVLEEFADGLLEKFVDGLNRSPMRIACSNRLGSITGKEQG